MTSHKLVWIAPENQGGIRSYTEMLWPAVKSECSIRGIETNDPLFGPIAHSQDVQRSVSDLLKINPTLIHVQHEYGLFGSKTPGLYKFPTWIAEVRKKLPEARIFATAHTVLGEYSYPISGRGWQIPFRWLANRFLLKSWQRVWNEKTWGSLDTVFVHSKLQVATVLNSGCRSVKEVPHFVPDLKKSRIEFKNKADANSKDFTLLIFGYLTPEKGQDIVIRAMAELKIPCKLIIAGGPRTEADQSYEKQCRQLIQELNLQQQVDILGYVKNSDLDSLYEKADLVLAPFRATTGSGSLVQALGRGAPVLASDLPLNREVEERVPGCLAFFIAGDPKDCARGIQYLQEKKERLAFLCGAAKTYADVMCTENIAREYLQGYERK